MLRLSALPLCLLPLAGLLGLWLLAAPPACAEEVLVLDNGVVLRGHVVRERDGQLTVQLAGFTGDSRVTVDVGRVVNRYRSIDREHAVRLAPPVGAPAAGAPVPGGEALEPVPVYAPTAPPDDGLLPEEEPPPAAEPFFERLRRVTPLSLPRTPLGLGIMGFLLFVCLGALVTMGARWLDMGLPSLQAAWTLALLFGTFTVADLLLHHELLRADRALWVLLLQAVLWLGVAKALLESPTPRTILLLAFVVFGSLAFVFVTGALLVSV